MDDFLNVFTVVICIAALHGIVLSAILWSKKKNRIANHILSVLVFLFSLSMGAPLYVFHKLYRLYPFFSPIFTSVPFTFGPLLYFYIKALTRPRFSFKRIHLLHGIPFAAAFIYYWYIYFGTTGAERLVMLEGVYFQPSPAAYVSMVASLLQAFIYIVFCFHAQAVHARKVKESFSSLDKVNLSWIRHLVFLFVSIWIIVTGLQWFLPAGLIEQKVDDAITYFLISLVIFSIGYRGLSQPEIFARLPEEAQPDQGKKYEKTGLSPKSSGSLLDRLLRFMDEEKPFLQPELTLPQLSEILDIPAHHLSQVINEKLEQNFFKFVNGYRVEAAKTKLHHPQTSNDKLIKVAFDSGFNSLSTFNRVFKDFTGLTPSQFRSESKPLRH